MGTVKRRKSAAPASDLDFNVIGKTDELPARTRRPSGTKYAALIDAIENLKRGESLEIAPPQGTPATTFRNRLTYVMHKRVMPRAQPMRNGETPKWRMYVSVNDTVVIQRVQ
jgi:hypothetical protein